MFMFFEVNQGCYWSSSITDDSSATKKKEEETKCKEKRSCSPIDNFRNISKSNGKKMSIPQPPDGIYSHFLNYIFAK